MRKRIILVTGTPSVGKTSAARLLAAKLDALYINLTDLAIRDNLVQGKDEKRNTLIINEPALRNRIRVIAEKTEKKEIVIDGHYAVNVVPPRLVTFVFVLRRDPVELREFMKKRGFTESKIAENLEAEILDVCLFDALKTQPKAKICELDATGKTAEEIVKEILDILADRKKCRIGFTDWIGKLESEGVLKEYLKI